MSDPNRIGAETRQQVWTRIATDGGRRSSDRLLLADLCRGYEPTPEELVAAYPQAPFTPAPNLDGEDNLRWLDDACEPEGLRFETLEATHRGLGLFLRSSDEK